MISRKDLLELKPLQMHSLIFFDIETTGLPNDNQSDPLLNSNRCKESPKERTIRLERLVRTDGARMPRVTELSLVTVPRQLFQTAAKQMDLSRYIGSNGEDCFERVAVAANVFTCQLNPELTQQQWAEYEEMRKKTPCIKLKRVDLECKSTFAREWPIIHSILENSPKPACLIAHNGINFDFRIIAHELRRAGPELLANWPIPEKVFFLDSLHSFIELEMEYNRDIEKTTQNINWPLVFSQIHPQLNEPGNANTTLETTEDTTNEASTTAVQVHCTSSSFMNVGEFYEERYLGTNDNRNPPNGIFKRPDKAEQLQKTPEKKIQADESAPIKSSAKRALPFSQAGTIHPISFMRTDKWSPAKRRRINPDFFERSNKGDWDFNAHQARQKMLSRGNFRLENLHNRFFPETFASHRAQSDSEALLQIALTYGEDFLNYLDRNGSAFPDCFRA